MEVISGTDVMSRVNDSSRVVGRKLLFSYLSYLYDLSCQLLSGLTSLT
jgi:hypothetical protein